ncbi:hypothetical protein ARMSODRAFT_1079588 [Armillaria solidipes]|uniref:Uncharacterized protein n=1 Tax=Armillaria solidipes TaxID=1076256 RepID=A0A2H3CGS9_9AGAR|nr:hypothetical protein ARMSODRAFT_1079588 [Armillaria solidipes]
MTIAWHDGTSITIMSIYLSLAVGTIGTYTVELQALCKDMLDCIFNSPNRATSRYMPPTVPKPCYTVVWSQPVVDSEKRGIRPFVVQLNDGVHMCKGVTAKSIFLSGLSSDPLATNFRRTMTSSSSSVGTLALASLALQATQIAAHIAYKYSLRRKVGIPAQPIISFRTQQIPIFTADLCH